MSVPSFVDLTNAPDAERPSFNTLQNYSATTAPIFYYVFDVLALKGAR
ncbi:MAG TPA: hypothetical protein VJU53_09315 [Burkholderiaceae bacterium]|nr:hypothetical protein [Burkholderiaceae bacterium]